MMAEFKLSYTAAQVDERLGRIDILAKKNELPTKTSELVNDSGFLTSIPNEYVTETKLNAKGYLTEHQSLDGLATEDYVDVQISAIPIPDVSGQISMHNISESAHNDIRSSIEELENTVNGIAVPTKLSDLTDDSTHRVVTDIEKSSWSAKAAVSDIPTNVSQLTNDVGYLTEHQSLAEYAKTSDLGDLATKDTISKSDLASDVQTSLDKADTALQSYTETDPTVPAWAKASTKPTYTAVEVGALPDTTEIPNALSDLTDDSTHRVVTDSEKATWNAKAEVSAIPTKVSELTNDSGYLTSVPVTSVNGKTGAISLSATDIGADASGTASSVVSTHNTNISSHSDIRDLISALTTRLNTLADSDDTTLDQMSEIVAYIKSNKTLIEEVTTNKVNVSDIVDNLITNVSNKPLSAAQGVALKALIDAIAVPTKISQLTNDSNYITAIPSEYVTETELNAKGYLTEHQDISGKLDASALPTAINNALTQAKASGEFDGKNGDPGYSPVRGTDYWTDADKAEIKAYVDEAILGGAW